MSQLKIEGCIAIIYMKEVETRIIQNALDPVTKISLGDWGTDF